MLQGGLLALLSIAIVLVVCETALRLLHPRYQAAASPIVIPLEPKRWATYHRGRHPDTGVEHLIVFNNLGGRQSRSFSAASLDSAVNIAFFGDSQTANNSMPAPYSFTEPLDHLLNTLNNTHPPHPVPDLYNVLNFGLPNYGTGLSWQRWWSLPVRRDLAHVFYVLWNNDLRDLGKNLSKGYVRVGVSGEILEPEGGVPHSPLWKRMLAHLHLTYLAIDAWHRLAPNFGRPAGDFGTDAGDAGNAAHEGRGTTEAQTLRVFRELLRSWKRGVEADGGAFHVVLLPSLGPIAAGWIYNDEALRDELQVLDLRDCSGAADPPSDYRKWRFATDGHWNPAANMEAARCLYHYLEGVLDLPERSNKDLADTLHAYYRAFLESSVWKGERYVPDTVWARSVAARDDGAALDSSDLPDPHSGSAIVGKYLALELSWSVGGAWMSPKEDRWLEAVSSAREAGVLATSVWDVYAHSAATVEPPRLVYVKPCAPDFRPVGHFFLHVVPFTLEKLHAERMNASSDFVNLDRLPHSPMRRHGGECVFSVLLPNYPLSAVRTGRYTTVGEGVDVVYRELWSARFQMRLAHSVWDLYASARGRTLDYVKSPCGPADTEARFFLHVFPLRSADLRDLPVAGVLRRYANLDFEWGENGLRTDGACRISVALPDFPIAFVRTGQFRDGVLSSKRLWSARIDFDEVERTGES